MARTTAGGVPVAVFERAPGVPAVAVSRLPDVPLTAAVLPGRRTHTHDFLVLFYAARAAGTVVIDDRNWSVADGDLFVIAPGQVLSFPEPADGMVADGWVVFFPADVIRSGACSSWRAHPLLFPFAHGARRAQRLHLPPADRDGWVAGLRALDAELRARASGFAEAALAHLTLLLVAVARRCTGVAEEPLIAAVLDVVERRFAEPISLADVAAELSLTPGHLTTVVRRRTGRTVQQWLGERRMQEARLLLTDTDLTVAAIAHRVGYPDVSYFIRRFRTAHGLTPCRWRTYPDPP
ncbi:AraC family transcriptional regulator [Actinoplanes sp. SE50]|nr:MULTISPECIES: AraC family transcriptional regulator [unclassified Actinoplanes]AEV84029.1 HTH-type transcriptional activator rhaS [Actinoplanes sp. SE50/110]ATO82422.1 AraC family transcriptional regulator [Actinoplanes sp. SE50]SLL99829.1 AraC family transcriptional regulator [Actinoplanes sp. SE50/110]